MIEDHWEDFIIYYVVFKTKNNGLIHKTIVLNELEENYSDDEVRKIVSDRFNNVVSVEHVDYGESCLVAKR